MAIDVDFLVMGSGLAGLNATLRLAPHGRVLLATKRNLTDSATHWAQGGIAAVASNDDSFEQHTQDTLSAGAGLCREPVVRSIIQDGPQAIERLIALGIQFDRRGNSFDLTREAGHTSRRIFHVQDFTGRDIIKCLTSIVSRNDGISVLTHHTGIDLITGRKLGLSGVDRCLGAHLFDIRNNKVVTVRAKATLLATGGAGKTYLYTSNPDVASGDGVAMGWRAGATIGNMEFFQFHPTCLYHPREKSFLISEALRGEGGILRRKDGSKLMTGVHPLADLAPRDVVARAIDHEMKRSGDDCVWLDMSNLSPAFIAERFPNIHTACLTFGIDMTKEAIPVVPAAHYMCGGVMTDAHGTTSIPGLWVAGETGCTGLHGANRLASNSLLETTVVSERASLAMIEHAKELQHNVAVVEWDEGRASDPDEMVVVSHNWDELRRLMWNYVGIVRSDKRLARALSRLELLREEIHDYYWNFKLTQDLLELRNIATVARLIVASAEYRRESRGLHYNLDTPETRTEWQHDTVLHRGPRDSILFHDSL